MKKIIQIALLLSTFTTPVSAEIDLNQFDRNGDRILDRSERKALIRSLRADNTEEADHWIDTVEELEIKLNTPDTIHLADIEANKYTAPLECKYSQRVFLRDSVIAMPLLTCPERRPDSSGASFSFTQDLANSTKSVAVEGALGFLILAPDHEPKLQPDGSFTTPFSNMGILAFTEVDGVFNSNGNNSGYARIGASAEILLPGKKIEATTIDGAGYFTTDLNLDASGYGFEVGVIPYSSKFKLNTAIDDGNDTRLFYWIAKASVDALHINLPGNTGLASDTDYVWLGGEIGFVYSSKPKFWKNGIRANAKLTYDTDLLADRSALSFDAKLNFALDPDANSAISFGYTRGKKRRDLITRDLVSVKLTFRY